MAAGPDGHRTAAAAGSALECFLGLLRRALAAGDVGWTTLGGGSLEWLLAALAQVLTEPAVQQ